ncbi:MAG TPA: hypothetical protein VGJ26_13990, partial [Pirellulales bacterium]
MNRRSLGLYSLCLLLAAGVGRPVAAAEAPGLEGNWKLVLLTFNEFPFGVMSISGTATDLKGEFRSAQRQFGQPKISEVKLDGDKLRVEFLTGGRNNVFTGAVSKEGDKPILGTLRL